MNFQLLQMLTAGRLIVLILFYKSVYNRIMFSFKFSNYFGIELNNITDTYCLSILIRQCAHVISSDLLYDRLLFFPVVLILN